MRADVLLADALSEGKGSALGQATGVDEDEGRAVLLDKLGEAVVGVAPMFAGGDGLEISGWYLDLDCEVALMAGVDDGAIWLAATIHPIGAEEKAGRFVDRLDGGGEADAGRALLARTGARPGANVIEAGEGEGEVAAALVAEEGVDFVDDDGLYGAEDFAAALGGEHEVEGLRCGDQNVRRCLDDRLALALGGVAGAEGCADAVRWVAELKGDLLDLGERVLEVAADVVAECLERRDVKDVDFVGQRLLLGPANEAVDGDEEGGEGLAGAGGGGDEGVAARRNLGPAEGLGVGGGAEFALEPGADGGVEGGEDVVGH